jgi:Fe-S-cluster containining protein
MFSESGTLNLSISGCAGEAPNACINCSACCQFCGEPPFSNIAECEKLLPPSLCGELLGYYNNIVETRILTRGMKNLPCMWLDVGSGICKYYEFRPEVCRNFVTGGIDCKDFINRVARDS